MTMTSFFRYALCAVGLLVCLLALSSARAQDLGSMNTFAVSNNGSFAGTAASYGVDPVLVRAMERRQALEIEPGSAAEAAELKPDAALDAVSGSLERQVDSQLGGLLEREALAPGR